VSVPAGYRTKEKRWNRVDRSVGTSKQANKQARMRSIQAVVPLLLQTLLLALPAHDARNAVDAWEPNWDSLDSRPLPPWFDESKFGIFIHWGVFSVPSFGTEWFWYSWKDRHNPDIEQFVNQTERPGFTYQEYAPRFTADLYDPNAWAHLFAKSGAQYVVLTSKHHEGYCMWDSRDVPTTWNWNVMDVGPHRDLLGDLSKSVKRTKSPHTDKYLHWGAYHSLFEWYNPLYLTDKSNDLRTTTFRDSKTMPELYDLVRKYEPELIWSDGDWAGSGSDQYWNSPQFLAWYATNSTVADTAVWNDRWGDTSLKHGAYYSGRDRYQPGKLLNHKWENALTIDFTSWGYNRAAPYENYASVQYLVHELAETVAFGGNMLLNVGPRSDGTIDPIFHDRLLGIGSWLMVNGDAIYGTKPWKTCQNETLANVYYTTSQSSSSYTRPRLRSNLGSDSNSGTKSDSGLVVYAIATSWPKDNVLRLQTPMTTPNTIVRMLGLPEQDAILDWSTTESDKRGIVITVPALTPDAVPCLHAWVFAMTGLAGDGDVDKDEDGGGCGDVNHDEQDEHDYDAAIVA